MHENNVWWGDGFTEWTNVQKAKPLFPGHQQPMAPLDDNYYDLTDPASLVWQSDLAREYGVEGFIFFHYWYRGKLLLEKPVELYRETPEASTEFCLCWANHPWTRSWDGKENDVLQPQEYGGREDWDSHFDYLLPFFEDSRYITRDGHPVLFLYNASDIPDVDDMLEHWNGRLKEEGIRDLYVVEYISTKNPKPHSALSAAVYEDEPVYTLRFEIPPTKMAKRLFVKKTDRIDYQDYDDVWTRMLRKRRTYEGRKVVSGAFVAWDNSPRRGERGPMIVRNASPAAFEKYLRRLVRSPRVDKSEDFLVINAWNEWGEGAMLEPSQSERYGYLEALRRVFNDPEVR